MVYVYFRRIRMKIIVGLGNIGKEYEETRHNVGFMFVDYYIKEVLKQELSYKKRDNYYYFEANINNEKIIVIKPTTYMNLSGEAIAKVKNWYKVENEDIIVIYDDVDIKLGTFRYRENGSAGTHNGMRNILSILKTQELKRFRIGIENREDKNIPLMDYVLGKFSKEELDNLYTTVFMQLANNLIKILEEK